MKAWNPQTLVSKVRARIRQAIVGRARFVAVRTAYVVVILFATLTGLEPSSDLAAASVRLSNAFQLSFAWGDAFDDLRNIALFAGLGVVWVMTSVSSRVRQEVWRATLTGCAISVFVEGLQVFSPIRTASIIDVSTNTAGAFIGAAGIALVLGAIHRAKGAKSYVGVPTILIAGPYLGAVLCEALAPLFHSEPLPQLEGPPIARLATAISLARPLSWNEVPWSDGPLFLVAGFLFIALLRELDRSERSSTLGGSVTATIAASAILVAAHVVHAVAGLSVRFEAAATDALFFSLGAGAAHVWLGALTRKFRGAARPRAFLFSYSVLLVLWAWRPLIPEFSAQKIASQVTLIAFVPLGSLATRVDVFSVLHVAQQFLLYVPVGALLAVWPLRAAGKSAGLWPVVWFVLALEVGHLFVAERLFDMTNAMIAVSGLGLAWLGVRRSGFRQYGTLLREKRPVL